MAHCGELKGCPGVDEMIRSFSEGAYYHAGTEAGGMEPESIIDPSGSEIDSLTAAAGIIGSMDSGTIERLRQNPDDRSVFCPRGPREQKVGSFCVQLCPYNQFTKKLNKMGLFSAPEGEF